MAVDIIVVSHHGSINAHEDAGAETTDLFTSMEMQVHEWIELQALVYDILPSATAAVFSYAIGSRKLSANERFFVGAQTEKGLLQTQIKQGESFVAANKVCTSTNKTTIVWIETELFFFFLFFTRGGCVSCLRACFGPRLLLQSY